MSDDVDVERDVQILQSRMDSLSDTVEEVQHLVAGEEYHDIRQQRDNLWRVVEQLLNRIDTLEDRLDTLEGLHKHEGKDAKVRAIVRYAQNQRQGDQKGVAVTPKEITGIVGCSRRYAYDLLDELPTEYPFLISRKDARQYGELEMDLDKMQRALVVVLDEECEQVHTEVGVVNHFTTPPRRKGGSA